MSNIPKELTDKLEAFLAVRGESEGGFAEVRRDDVSMLHEIIHEIAKAKYEEDPSGNPPIEWSIIDRTKYEPTHFRPVRYRHDVYEIEDDPVAHASFLEEVFDGHLHNLSMAMSRVDTEMRIRQSHRLDEEKDNATFQKGEHIRCVKKEEDWHDISVGTVYTADTYSYFSEGREYVRIEFNDSEEPFTSWYADCFERVED